MKQNLRKYLKGRVFIAIGLLMVVASVWYAFRKQETWQAVFLTNNQVYFGHLSYFPLRSTATLREIYYLQVTQPLQPQEQTWEQVDINMEIIKFGGEIHGPEDKMVIPKSQIQFWEDLRQDSPVVEAIREYRKRSEEISL